MHRMQPPRLRRPACLAIGPCLLLHMPVRLNGSEEGIAVSDEPAEALPAEAPGDTVAAAEAARSSTKWSRWAGGMACSAQGKHALKGTWVCLVVLGLLQCTLAWLVGQLTYGMGQFHRSMPGMPEKYGLENPAWTVLAFLVWVAWRAGALFAAGMITSRFSGVAAGSGIADMKCVLAGFDMPDHVSPTTGCTKAAGLVLACASGLPVGRVGPLVHISGCLASWLLQSHWFAGLQDSKEGTYQVLGAACAVGVTSAFGSPVGGVLFSIEVTATYYLTSSYWRAFLSAVSGCVVYTVLGSRGWGTEAMALGNSGDTRVEPSALTDSLLPHIALGVLSGALAGLWTRSVALCATWRRQPEVVARFGAGMALPCALAALSAVVDWAAGDFMQLGLIEGTSATY